MFHLSCGGDDPNLVGCPISAWAFHCRGSHEGEGGGAENPSGRLEGRQGELQPPVERAVRRGYL
jgi:hypothetical protein